MSQDPKDYIAGVSMNCNCVKTALAVMITPLVILLVPVLLLASIPLILITEIAVRAVEWVRRA